MQKDTYRRIKKFSENMEAMLRVYGMLELEDAYKIYCTLYDKNQDKTEFYRYVYWYGSFNCIFKTAYTGDGRCFSFIEDIDSQKVIAMQEKYAADMDYASFSIEDIRLLSENLANRTEWIDILFSKLRYQVNIPLEAAERCLISTVIGIMNGTTLEEAFEAISEWSLIMEIERKYLIDRLPENLEQYECKHIEQGYLNTDPVVRIRKSNDKYTLTYKGAGLMCREEYNLPLTKESYEHMRPKADGILISKTRYLIPEKDGLTIELDIFEKDLEGLVVAEVEFDSVEEAESYNPPAWFKEDVTMNKMYHNSNMSMLDVSHINTGNGE